MAPNQRIESEKKCNKNKAHRYLATPNQRVESAFAVQRETINLIWFDSAICQSICASTWSENQVVCIIYSVV